MTQHETFPQEQPITAEEPPKDKHRLPGHLTAFFIGGFVLSLAIDQLFWQKSFGFSYLIWVVLILLATGILANIEKKRPHPTTYVLIAGILITTCMAVWRQEPGTRAYNVLFSLLLIALTCDSLLSGEAFHFRIGDAILRLFLVVFAAIERPIVAVLSFSDRSRPSKKSNNKSWRTFWLPVLRGFIIAIPVLLIFAALLASADPVFDDFLKNIGDYIKIDNWAEFAFRIFYILVLGFCFSGLLMHAFSQKRYYTRSTTSPSGFRPFLGKIETYTILALVIGLFAMFIFIQFRYFFGGTANISFTGYTYAEYARKGAEELIVVAILTLALYQVLHAITRLDDRSSRIWLHVLMSILIIEVLVILFSSYQRLTMYETIYGFSRIRVRTHLFILWLSALLTLVVVLEWRGKSQQFFLVLLMVSFGFVISQGFLNIDQHIVEKNLARLNEALPAEASESFDHYYLTTLSDDAVSVMVRAGYDPQVDADTQEMFLAELSCRRWQLEQDQSREEESSWVSQNPSSLRAEQLLLGLNNLPPVEADRYEDTGVWLQNGEMHYCYDYWGWD